MFGTMVVGYLTDNLRMKKMKVYESFSEMYKRHYDEIYGVGALSLAKKNCLKNKKRSYSTMKIIKKVEIASFLLASFILTFL